LKKLLLVAVLAALGELVGCSDAQFPYLTAIQVAPATPSVAAGRTQQFTATGTFSNSQTRDITSLVTWTSSAPPVSTINSAGLAQSYSQGASTITATFTGPAAGTVTGTVTFNVAAPALVAVVVTDAAAVVPGTSSLKSTSVARGTGHQYLAYGIYSDGGERNITNSVTWASAPVTVATITNTGRATSIAAGTATITATDPTTGTVSSPSSLVVTNATIASIVVYPRAGQTIAPLTRQPFGALGQFSDNTTQDITADANWVSTNVAAATVSNATPKGVATGVAFGTTVLQASFGGTTGQALLVVSAASLTSITLTPAPATGSTGVGVAVGSTLPITAVGTFSDGSKQTINLGAAWTVTPSNGSFATVDQTGLVTGVAAGSATVTAKFGTITTNAVINVQTIKSILVAPSTTTIAQGTATQYVATATLTDGTTQNISASATWIAISPPAVSGTPPVVTISDALGSSGWATGGTPGAATVGAVFGGQYSLSGVTVTNATLKTLAITPTGNVHVAFGGTQQYQATGTFSDSTTQNLTNQVTWISSVPGVAYINLTGLATNTGPGTTNVTATSNITTPATTSQVAVFSNP
jgi:hypothetical protein